MGIKVRGLDEAIANMRAVGERIADLQPVLDKVAEEMKDVIEVSFTKSESASTGAPWAPTSLATLQMRQRKGLSSTSPLVASGRLQRSIKTESTEGGFSLFSDLSYAAVQNYGNPRNQLFGTSRTAAVPARPFLTVEGGRFASGALAVVYRQAILDLIPTYIVEGRIP